MEQLRVNVSEPYVGPVPIETGQLLFGRDREVRTLTNLLVAKRIVLLHAPSGAGKSSLVKAGLIPEMQKKRLRVLPVIRVNGEVPSAVAEVAEPETVNRYTWSTLRSLEEDPSAESRLPDVELVRLDLAAYLDRQAEERGKEEAVLLIFDQFEELLTVDPLDLDVKRGFVEGVGQALKDRRRWAIFVMRDDYVGSMSPYFQYIPTYLSVDMPLDLLKVDAAVEAIQRPRREGQQETAIINTFTAGAARMLANSLAQVLVRQMDGHWQPQTGAYVEPLHLQIVCKELWDNRPAGVDQLDERLIERVTGRGDPAVEGASDRGERRVHWTVDRVLADYYAKWTATVAAETGVPERAIREWFDRHLITAQGIRGQVLAGPEGSQGLDNRAIERLVNAYLVRREERRGATWFELAHDRLIGPLSRDNKAWYRSREGTSITIRIHDWDRRSESHLVEATLDDGRFFYGGELCLDEYALQEVAHDPQAYGTRLSDMLFTGPMKRAYEAAIERARERTRGRLRFRLWIDSESMEMHALPWERLYHVEKGQSVPLATSDLISFSRYKGVPSVEPNPISERPLRLLIAISNPANLQDFQLPPISVEQEVRNYDAALGDLQRGGLIQVTFMPGISGLTPESQAELQSKGYQIEPGITQWHEVLRLLPHYHILHFHGLGGVNRAGEGFLIFEGSDGQVKIATEEDLMPRLASIPLPRLVVLDAQEMVGLAPKLIRAGVPAVLTFHGQTSVHSALVLVEDFYRQLCERGTVDEALNHARAALRAQGSEEWAHPVLFTSLERAEILSTRLVPASGSLPGPDAHRELTVRIRPLDEEREIYPVEATLDDGGVFYGGGLRPYDLPLGSGATEPERLKEQIYRQIGEKAEAAGLMLFEALFSGPTRRAYEKGIDRADTQTEGRLRFRLWIDDGAAELHALPWELLYGVRGLQPVPLAASPLTPFTRYTAVEVVEGEPITKLPLHLLVAISSPRDARGIDPEQLGAYLRPTLEEARQAGLVHVTLMPGHKGLASKYWPRLEQAGYRIHYGATGLREVLRILPTCHLFQFFGPSLRAKDGSEALVFEDGDGGSHLVHGKELEGMWESIASPPYLVVLSTSDATVRTALRLARRRGTAVVAFQGPMLQDDLWPFVHKFYLHLFEHGLVDRAVNEARLAIFQPNRSEWTLPVLLMGLPQGRLFQPPLPDQEGKA